MFMQDLRESHMKTAKRIVQYIKVHISMALNIAAQI
jgi:hypothetical protein